MLGKSRTKLCQSLKYIHTPLAYNTSEVQKFSLWISVKGVSQSDDFWIHASVTDKRIEVKISN